MLFKNRRNLLFALCKTFRYVNVLAYVVTKYLDIAEKFSKESKLWFER